MIIPVLDGLQHLLQSADGGLDVLREVLLRLLKDKFGDVFADDKLCVATVVDPRFKCVPFDSEGRLERAKQLTLQCMEHSAMTVIDPAVATGGSGFGPSAPATQNQSNRPSIWDKFDSASKTLSSTPAVAPQQELLCRELNMFLSEPPISRTACPLRWWANNQANYANIASVARRLLSVPATSVAKERLFSRAEDIMSKKRNQLAPSKADRIIFLMDNLE